MKQLTTKKLFIFIITVMMFSLIPALVNAQKKCRDGHCPKGQTCINGYCVKSGGGTFCNCFVRPIPVECGQYCGWLIPINQSLSISSANSKAISFQLTQTQSVSAKIYDAAGRLIKTLTDDKMQQGSHQIGWDRKDQTGKAVSAGIYILKFETGNKLETKKIIVTS